MSSRSTQKRESIGPSTSWMHGESTYDPKFKFGLVTQPLIEMFDKLRRERVYRDQQLPVPCSFLFDSEGQFRCLFIGGVTPDAVVDEVSHFEDEPKQRESRSVPFPGRWAKDLFITNPIAIASVYREEGQLSDAREYLTKFLNGLAGTAAQGRQPGGAPNSDASR